MIQNLCPFYLSLTKFSCQGTSLSGTLPSSQPSSIPPFLSVGKGDIPWKQQRNWGCEQDVSRGRALSAGALLCQAQALPQIQGRQEENPGPCVQRVFKNQGRKSIPAQCSNGPTQNTLSSKAWELGVRFMAAKKDHEHLSCSYCTLLLPKIPLQHSLHLSAAGL